METNLFILLRKQSKVIFGSYLALFVLLMLNSLLGGTGYLKLVSVVIITIINVLSSLRLKKTIKESSDNSNLVFGCVVFLFAVSVLNLGLFHLDFMWKVLGLLSNVGLYDELAHSPIWLVVIVETFLGAGIINEMLLASLIISWPFKRNEA